MPTLRLVWRTRSDGEVLGVAWDGAGYGSDGSIWGGEFLIATYRESQRVAHLRPFRLPGGEQAAREPRRAALAVRWETFGAQGCLAGVEEGTEWRAQAQLLVAMLAKQIQSPVTTSMGRLFDAVASMLGLCQVAGFEGQAAMALEQEGIRASVSVHGEDDTYPIPLIARDEAPRRWIADWRPMIALIADDLSRGIERSRIAHRFHRSLAELIGQAAERVGVRQVVLTGGCFQNVLLADLARARLESAGFVALTHRRSSPERRRVGVGTGGRCRNPIACRMLKKRGWGSWDDPRARATRGLRSMRRERPGAPSCRRTRTIRNVLVRCAQ